MSDKRDVVELYVVIDVLAGARITDAIPARSRGLAIFGFCQMVDKEIEAKKLPKRNYSLYFIGEMDADGRIDPAYELVCNGEDAQEFFERFQQELYDKELQA